MGDILIDAYQTLHESRSCMDLSWDEFMAMLSALGCIWNLDEETVAEWLVDNVELPYLINCQKELKPHGTVVVITGS